MTEQVTITINSTTLTVPRFVDGPDGRPVPTEVCVVYMGTVGEAENVHTAPIGCESPGLEYLRLEAGGSLVNAGLLADHIAKPHPAFKRLLAAGAFTVYATPAEAMKAPTKHVTDMVKITRHARTLREWLTAEEAREPKRRVMLDGLRERIRIYGEHSTPVISIASLTHVPKSAEPDTRRKKVG